MFWSNKHRRLRRSKRPPRSLRYQYQEREPTYSRSYSYDPPHLNTLPPELHLEIFDNLDPVSSACFGLTNKRFYPMHRAAHRGKKIGLYQGAEQPLHVLLEQWKPRDLVLDWESERLVSRDRLEILDEVRRREKERRLYWTSANASYHTSAYRAHDWETQPRHQEGRRRLRRKGRFYMP